MRPLLLPFVFLYLKKSLRNVKDDESVLLSLLLLVPLLDLGSCVLHILTLHPLFYCVFSRRARHYLAAGGRSSLTEMLRHIFFFKKLISLGHK